MADEENKDSTSESVNKDDGEGTEGNTEGTNSEDSSSKEGKIDYEAELARERERRETAEKALADKAFKSRDKKRKEEDEDGDEPEEDKPLTSKELQTILERDREQTRKEMQSEVISEKAKKLAGSDAEASLIVEIHKNRSFPAGMPLDEQLEEAYAIANRKSLIAQNAELKRALQSKGNVSDNSVNAHREPAAAEESKMSANDVGAIKDAGYVWDGKSGLYKKPLGGKKVLVYNPKTKTRKVMDR